jgi:UDP-N-acetylglucosamine/UDP-N-acetylgalactosamine 4-epimerase
MIQLCDIKNFSYKLTEEQLQYAYNNKPVLVTGGAGFIGSHIVDRLINLGAQVTVLDDLSTGNLDNLSQSHKKITFIQASINNLQSCIDSMQEKITIFHLAAKRSVPQSMKNPLDYNATNVTGTLNILEAARIYNASCIVFSSSSSIYGNYTEYAHENDTCFPISPYGASKYNGEIYCRTYSEAFKIPTICLRYFNVYGERQNPHGPYACVIAKFNNNILHNKPLTIFGDGKQNRDFTPINLVVEANIRLALANKTILNGQPINVGTGKSISILEVIEQFKKNFPHYQQKPLFMPKRNGDPLHSQANCNLLWKLI